MAVPSGSPCTSPAARSQRAASSPVATDMRSVGSTAGSRRSVGSSSARARWATRHAGAATTSWVVLGAEAGDAVGSRGHPHRRAVADGVDAAAPLDDRLADPAGAAQGVGDDGDARLALGLDREVLPPAAAAPGPARRARRHDAVRRGVEDVDAWPRAQSFFSVVSSTATVSPGSAPRTNTMRPPSSRAIASPPAANRSGRSVRTGTDGRLRRVPSTPMAEPDRSLARGLDRLTRPIQIAPSVLPVDFARLGEAVTALDKAGVDLIQWDVMDGQFVPNLTFGPDVIHSARSWTDLPFEAHLMVYTPERMAARYVEAGCRRLIVHAEACTHLHRVLGQIGELGAAAGVALSPATPADAVAHVLDLVELVLVMTVNPGFGGQPYIATMEPKIAEVRAMIDAAGLRRSHRPRGRRRHQRAHRRRRGGRRRQRPRRRQRAVRRPRRARARRAGAARARRQPV